MENRPEHAREHVPHYASYLLRLRYTAGPSNGAVDRDGRPVCQAMLQNVATEERRYFDNLASLIAFLEEEARSEVLYRD
jgi:hypothetical protein